MQNYDSSIAENVIAGRALGAYSTPRPSLGPFTRSNVIPLFILLVFDITYLFFAIGSGHYETLIWVMAPLLPFVPITLGFYPGRDIDSNLETPLRDRKSNCIRYTSEWLKQQTEAGSLVKPPKGSGKTIWLTPDGLYLQDGSRMGWNRFWAYRITKSETNICILALFTRPNYYSPLVAVVSYLLPAIASILIEAYAVFHALKHMQMLETECLLINFIILVMIFTIIVKRAYRDIRMGMKDPSYITIKLAGNDMTMDHLNVLMRQMRCTPLYLPEAN